MNKLIDLYQQVLRIRLIEEEIAKRYSEQKMRCPTHLSIGQEAVAVGISSLLTIDDKAYSSHRAHAHYLAKGGDLKQLIAELYGKKTGCTGGRGGSMHLTDLDVGFVASTAIVANSIPVAVGNALHQKVHHKNELSIAYFGDGATEEGAFYESANFAAVKKLPILFVCENNQYSVYSPLKDRQPSGRSISRLAKEIGVESIEVDGNDIESIITASEKLIQHIRNGNGPALIECHTYRHREHCGPGFDDHLEYRPSNDVEKWLAKDPLIQLENKLSSMIDWYLVKDKMLKIIIQEINSAFDFAEQSDFPDDKHNEKYLYAK
jgi:TPP-dependent pyruvate/acetoin dehydrogenase alpha subunit